MRFTLLRNHPDATAMIHTDSEQLLGAAWVRLLSMYGPRLVVKRRAYPRHQFGLPFRDSKHMNHLTALRVLRKYGGTFVSNDAYKSRPLSSYRVFECAVLIADQRDSSSLSADPQLILAHRDARLLHQWIHGLHSQHERRGQANQDDTHDDAPGPRLDLSRIEPHLF